MGGKYLLNRWSYLEMHPLLLSRNLSQDNSPDFVLENNVIFKGSNLTADASANVYVGTVK